MRNTSAKTTDSGSSSKKKKKKTSTGVGSGVTGGAGGVAAAAKAATSTTKAATSKAKQQEKKTSTGVGSGVTGSAGGVASVAKAEASKAKAATSKAKQQEKKTSSGVGSGVTGGAGGVASVAKVEAGKAKQEKAKKAEQKTTVTKPTAGETTAKYWQTQDTEKKRLAKEEEARREQVTKERRLHERAVQSMNTWRNMQRLDSMTEEDAEATLVGVIGKIDRRNEIVRAVVSYDPNSYHTKEEAEEHEKALAELKSLDYELANWGLRMGEQDQAIYEGLTSQAKDHTESMSKYKNEAEYMQGVGFAKKYSGMSYEQVAKAQKSIHKQIDELSAKGGDASGLQAEAEWLDQNAQSFKTKGRLQDERDAIAKRLAAMDEAAAKHEPGEIRALGAGDIKGKDSPERGQLQDQLSQLDALISAKNTADFVEYLPEDLKEYFLSGQYTMDARQQSTPTGITDATGKQKAAAFEKKLSELGYSKQDIKDIREYSKTEYNAIRAAQTVKNITEGRDSAYEKSKALGVMADVGLSAYSVGAQLVSGIGYIDQLAQGAVNAVKNANGPNAVTGQNRRIDTNTGAQMAGITAEAVRGNIANDLGSTLGFLYQTGMSIADFMLARKIPGSIKVGGASVSAAELMFGGAAAASTARAAFDRGASEAEALGAGADMEALFRIEARERIARAKTVPADAYESVYAEIDAAMREEIAQIRKGA